MQQTSCGLSAFLGQRQFAYREHIRKSTSTVHLPKQPGMLTEASSLPFSGAEKSCSGLAAKQLIFTLQQALSCAASAVGCRSAPPGHTGVLIEMSGRTDE